MNLTIQEASNITLRISNKSVILDNSISTPTLQSGKNIIFKKDYYCSDNIIHELCHYMVSNEKEKEETNLGLDTNNNVYVFLKEAEAFILQARFYKKFNLREDPESKITRYKKYVMTRLSTNFIGDDGKPMLEFNGILESANRKDLSKELEILSKAYENNCN